MPSPFPVRDAECEIRDSESDDNYLEGEHEVGNPGGEDYDDIPNT